MNTYDIRQFGAVGDGKTLDTRAIQAAIDAAHAAGGGTAYCPPGEYYSGSIELKANVTLHLEANARIVASRNRSDYVKRIPMNASVRNFDYDHHLLFARNADNIGITGRGTIDGNCWEFMLADKDRGHVAKSWRPGPMITFFECRNVLVRDVRIANSPSYTVWLLGCERVIADGVEIDTPRTIPNGDGFNICCCRSVQISNCVISAGDDCIAVYAQKFHLHHLKRCEDVTVTNCVLSGPCTGVRVGYESDGVIRNCTFSNLSTYANTAIDVLSSQQTEWLTEAEIAAEHGPLVENILFSNIVSDGNILFHMNLGETVKRPGGIRNIRYSNISGRTTQACFFSGSKEIPVEDIAFSNVRVTVDGEVTDKFQLEPPYPAIVWPSQTKLPFAFYFRYARNVRMKDVEVVWGDIKGAWQGAMRADHVCGLDVSEMIARQAPGSDSPVIDLSDTRDASLRSCRAVEGTNVFVRLQGAQSSLRAVGNDFSQASKPLAIGGGVPPGAWRESGNIANE